MRRLLTHRLVLLVAVLALVGQAAGASTDLVPDEQTYYLAWQDCGSGNDTYLSLDVPAANYCAWYGLPLGEVFHLAGEPYADSYTSQEGTPFTLDAERNLEGEIHVHAPSGLTGAGLGQVVIEGVISVRVPRPSGTGTQSVTVGSISGEGVATPADDTVAFPVDLDIPDSLDQASVLSITLDLIVRGLSIDSSTEASGGLSKLVIPTLVEADPS